MDSRGWQLEVISAGRRLVDPRQAPLCGTGRPGRVAGDDWLRGVSQIPEEHGHHLLIGLHGSEHVR
jgi:hypothetical protein